MYHINPARIKSILSSMPREQFITHARYIRRQVYKLPHGNRRQMFINLYRWCRINYRERWG